MNVPIERVDEEPYILAEISSIVSEYNDNSIVLSTFIFSCDATYRMAIGDQKIPVNTPIQNKLRERAADFIISSTKGDIKTLL